MKLPRSGWIIQKDGSNNFVLQEYEDFDALPDVADADKKMRFTSLQGAIQEYERQDENHKRVYRLRVKLS